MSTAKKSEPKAEPVVWVPYSKRGKPMPDVYTYDKLNPELRQQIAYIIMDVFGTGYYTNSANVRVDLFVPIHRTLRDEHGQASIGSGSGAYNCCLSYLKQPEYTPTERCLDTIELIMLTAENFFSKPSSRAYRPGSVRMTVQEGIAKLNRRFLEHGVGYQYDAGRIVKQTDEFIHQEVTRPALSFLRDPAFSGAEEEFHQAHQHFRKGHAKEALTCCRKAFESTMKSICNAQGWHYDERATAKDLIKIMFDQGLFPPMMQSYFDNLRGMMESCVPTVVNKRGAHGQGAAVVPPDEELTAYVMHQTAANILLLIQKHKTTK